MRSDRKAHPRLAESRIVSFARGRIGSMAEGVHPCQPLRLLISALANGEAAEL